MTQAVVKPISFIQILPPQLANQIAAGEVVERPASVVKELVENSIDANADSIHIEIEQGGHKRILIRDTGDGIAKDQLELALSRHATSKIKDIGDLEHISSMGFRGEALASISSVSRLTLTSKTASQETAWQAQAEGLDMAVSLSPAAHPHGTSIEVLDLFFNTPARRKFLRAQKTEFQHIEQIVRRIALAHPNIAFVLKHNGKIIHKWAAGTLDARVKAVCGQAFLNQCTPIDYRQLDIRLSGWCSTIGASWQTNEHQYIFVNNRMIRDKLALHAIRQAYEGMLPDSTHPAYVLFLNLPAEQMDINVHPAKHEVRFHQARQVHDLIFQALSQALIQAQSLLEQNRSSTHEAFDGDDGEARTEIKNNHIHPNNKHSPTATAGEYEPSHDYIRPLQTQVSESNTANRHAAIMQSTAQSAVQSPARAGGTRPSQSYKGANTEASGKVYQSLMQSSASEHLRYDYLISEQHVLFQVGQTLKVLPIAELFRTHLQQELVGSSVVQPLLMPVSVGQDAVKHMQNIRQMEELGCIIDHKHNKYILKQVPSGMRALPWAHLFVRLIEDQQAYCSQAACLSALAQHYFTLKPADKAFTSGLINGFDEQSLNNILSTSGAELNSQTLSALVEQNDDSQAHNSKRDFVNSNDSQANDS